MRLVFSLVMTVLGVVGYLAVDYNLGVRMGGNRDGSFGEYLASWVETLSSPAEGAGAVADDLAAMLPSAPEGWTVRASVPGEIVTLMTPAAQATIRAPASRDNLPQRLLEQSLDPREGRGIRQAQLTYENGDKRVLMSLVRHPDLIFTSFAGMANRFELQMTMPTFAGRPYATVRGLEIDEDVFPQDIGPRLFMANVGAQIQLRIATLNVDPETELLPFLAGLDVRAMNADVVERLAGLGEVPVVVFAQALDEELQRERAAERAAREAELAATRAAAREADEAAARAAAEAEAAKPGLKPVERLEGGGSLGSGSCEAKGGGKFCGARD